MFETKHLLMAIPLSLLFSTFASAESFEDYCVFGVADDAYTLRAAAQRTPAHAYGRARPMDVKHIRLDLSIDFDLERISGVATNTLTAIGKPLRRVSFDAVDLNVSRVTDGNGANLDFENTGSELHVFLDPPLLPENEIAISVEYSTRPIRGLHFRTPRLGYAKEEMSVWSQGEPEDNRHWFPTFDFPNERATSEIIVTFPKGFVALSNGVLLETKENADSTTAHWAQTIPHPSYLISLIVGHYVEINDEGGGVPLHYFVRPKFERHANLSFSKTGSMMKFFQDWIDLPYPYESYSQVAVVDFIFGGMENSSITTLTERTLHDEAAHLTYSSDGLVAHELAHQWWGDLLTCRDWTHLWLNEAFATYFQALYFEHDRGREDFDYEMLRYRRNYLARESIDAARPIVNTTLGRPGNALNRRIYDKGAWVLHMLRHRMGDALFQKGIREYGRTFQGNPVETNNLLRTLEAVSGEGLEFFFDQWVHHAGYPELEVDYSWSDETGVAEIRVRQTQALSEIVPLFHMDVDVLFVTKDGRHVEKIEISEASHTFQIKLNARPQYVRFDPDGNLLKRLAFHNSEDMTLAQLADDTTFLGQIEAIEELARFRSDDVVEALETVLFGDAFWAIRAEAANSLSKIQHPRVPDTLQRGLKVENARVRRAVARALGERKDETSGKALLDTVRQDESPYVVAAAIRAIGDLRYEAADRGLVKALSRESHNAVVRNAALNALLKLEEEPKVDRLLRYTESAATLDSHRTAIMGLAMAGRRLDHAEPALRGLTKLLLHPNVRIRLQAIAALGRLGDSGAIAELRRVAKTAQDPREQDRADQAIRAIEKKQSESQEIETLRDALRELEESQEEILERLQKLETQEPETP